MIIGEHDIPLEQITTALADESNKADYEALRGSDLFKSEVTQEGVESFLGTDAGKQFLQPKLDSYHTKGLNSYLEKNKEKFVAKDEVDQLIADNNSKIEELNGTLKNVTINSKFQKQLLKEGAKAEKVDLIMRLADTSKISLDGDNLIGSTDIIAALKEQAGEFFGESKTRIGAGTGNGNPPGGNEAEKELAAKNKMRAAAGLPPIK